MKKLLLIPLTLLFFSCDEDNPVEPENNSFNGAPELVIVNTTANANYSSQLLKLTIQIRNDGDAPNIAYAQYLVPGAMIRIYWNQNPSSSSNYSLLQHFPNEFLPSINPGEYFVVETDWLDVGGLIGDDYTWNSIVYYNSLL